MRGNWSRFAMAAVTAACLGAVQARAQQPPDEPKSEGHPHKWQVIEQSLYDVMQDGFDLAAVVYDPTSAGPGATTPDVHYFLQKGADLVRCDFRKREATSYYWCYVLTKPGKP